ncbi:pyroglutamyl-peptidase I [Proteiniclasticum ruminis]|uniref:Pyrrolidone-carboxylate peptidase n=1 Tax=Proteiniclasticum ruminis TaxID=398199 RepID=A0A1I5BZT7_9CLOT|nr:pyroglutamyl-peptidase I [Proteiniclasticum ruminis]SFN80238.1 pyroglutamyl-peptidase I Cysteine peptidase. MEROPS family C15 [Proteiniclasticum ruminis]
MKILVTAFDPFGGESINPALEAVKLMKDNIDGAEIVKLEIPTVFRKSIDKVAEAIVKEDPDVVLSIGQAGGRFEVTPERVAINVDDARIPDNEGNQPIDVPIYEDGAPAYFTTLPVKAMVEAIRSAGLPSSLSNSAGTFVCNHIMYGVLYQIEKMGKNIRAGFIHVPFIPEQVARRPAPAPCMSMVDIAKALEAAVSAIVKYDKDIVAVGGKID